MTILIVLLSWTIQACSLHGAFYQSTMVTTLVETSFSVLILCDLNLVY